MSRKKTEYICFGCQHVKSLNLPPCRAIVFGDDRKPPRVCLMDKEYVEWREKGER